MKNDDSESSSVKNSDGCPASQVTSAGQRGSGRWPGLCVKRGYVEVDEEGLDAYLDSLAEAPLR
jgi:hypothetical protein